MTAPDTPLQTICPISRRHWREWLHQHHTTRQSIWLIYHKKKLNQPGITYAEAVEEALCFGWIDSKSVAIDADSHRQFFSKRKPNGTWSKVNKERIERLTATGLMTAAGLATIDAAKQNGSWTILDEVEQHIIPPDLQQALQDNPGATTYFQSLCRSDRRNILQWLVLAKRPATRLARLHEIATLAAQGLKPKPFRR